ncbi:MAG: type II CAAX endopeptidase family protein [Planctomycetota bacterium]
MRDAEDPRPVPAAVALARLAVAGFVFTLLPGLLLVLARSLQWTHEGGTWDRAYGLGAFAASGIALLWLSFVLPPGRPLLPVRPLAVLWRYVLFAVPWAAALVGYLHLMHALGHSVEPQELLQYLASNGMGAHDSVVVVLAVVLGAPLAEELLFRGWLQQALEALLGARAALLTSAALFGLVHGLDYALPLTAVGLFLGWLRNRYGSLSAPMLAHALHNGLTAACAVYWPESLELMYPR